MKSAYNLLIIQTSNPQAASQEHLASRKQFSHLAPMTCCTFLCVNLCHVGLLSVHVCASMCIYMCVYANVCPLQYQELLRMRIGSYLSLSHWLLAWYLQWCLVHA